MKTKAPTLSAEAQRVLQALAKDGAKIEGWRQPPMITWHYRIGTTGPSVGTGTMLTLVRRGLVAPVGEVSAERAEFRITEKGRGAV